MGSVGAGSTRVRKTFLTEAEAEQWVKEQEALKAPVQAPVGLPPAVPTWTLQEAYDSAYRRHWKGKGGEKKAVLNATQALIFFGPNTPVSEISSKWISKWMIHLEDEERNSGSTRNKKLSALSVMLKEAQELGDLAQLPAMRRASLSRKEPRWFTQEEEAEMLAKATALGLHELHDLIIVGMDTGFRRGELLGLMVTDYSNGYLVLKHGETKSGHGRSVPASKRIRAILEARKKAGESRVFPTMTEASLRYQWETLVHLLGKKDDPKYIVHTMRHTCATRLVTKGVPLDAVRAWMGHSSISTTMIYAHLQPGRLDDALKKLEDDDE